MKRELMNLAHFYAFFLGVDEKYWCTSTFENKRGQMCANGLLGVKWLTQFPVPKLETTENSRRAYHLLTDVSLHHKEFFFESEEQRCGFTIAAVKDGYMKGKVEYSNKLASVNNGDDGMEYTQSSPKERVLAFIADALKIDGYTDEMIHAIEPFEYEHPVELKEEQVQATKIFISISAEEFEAIQKEFEPEESIVSTSYPQLSDVTIDQLLKELPTNPDPAMQINQVLKTTKRAELVPLE